MGENTNKKSNNNKNLNFTHCNNNWLQWDGGKIGGKPIWLNPRDIPTNLCCTSKKCCDNNNTNNARNKLSLLVQLYCPADDDSGEENAFRRTIYVFICNTCHDIKVLRCQLPRDNPFYIYQLESNKKQQKMLKNEKNTSNYWNVNVCSLCNQMSDDDIDIFPEIPENNNPKNKLSFVLKLVMM